MQRQRLLAIDEVWGVRRRFDDDVAILHVLQRVAGTVDRKQGLSDVRDGFAVQHLINQSPSGRMPLLLDPTVGKWDTAGLQVAIPQRRTSLSQRLAHDYPI